MMAQNVYVTIPLPEASYITFAHFGGLLQVRVPDGLLESVLRRLALLRADEGKTWISGLYLEGSEQGNALLAAYALLIEWGREPGPVGPTGASGLPGLAGPQGSPRLSSYDLYRRNL